MLGAGAHWEPMWEQATAGTSHTGRRQAANAAGNRHIGVPLWWAISLSSASFISTRTASRRRYRCSARHRLTGQTAALDQEAA